MGCIVIFSGNNATFSLLGEFFHSQIIIIIIIIIIRIIIRIRIIARTFKINT